jgi:hypothetical protein
MEFASSLVNVGATMVAIHAEFEGPADDDLAQAIGNFGRNF